MDTEKLDQIYRAKKRAVPFVVLTTYDSRAAAAEIVQYIHEHGISLQGSPVPTTAVNWDICRGLHATPVEKDDPDDHPNRIGAAWLSEIQPPQDDKFASVTGETESPPPAIGEGNPVEALEMAMSMPVQSILFIHQADRWINEDKDSRVTIQAIANLRDHFSKNNKMLVIMAPSIDLPHELRKDTIPVDDPLPSTNKLEKLFEVHKSLGKMVPKKKDRQRAASFVTGFSTFGAEQALYLATSEKGIDLDELRSLRWAMWEQLSGVSVRHCDFTQADVGSHEYIKTFFKDLATCNEPPNVIIHIGEIEKALAGSKHESTGISQDALGEILESMERNKDEGVILFGPPGCSKTFLAETLGPTVGLDTLDLDINGMKAASGGLSGVAEAGIRDALNSTKVLGRRLWIATCNDVSDLDAALMRRFTWGVVFCDLPGDAEKKQIWKLQMKQYGLTGDKTLKALDDTLWSGAEIRNCCMMAAKFGRTLDECAKNISPVAVADPVYLHEARKTAHGKFKSSVTGEKYVYDKIALIEERQKLTEAATKGSDRLTAD